MSRQICYVLVAGAVAVGVTVWITYPRANKFIGDPSQYKFMHCPKCRKETVFDLDKFVEGCARCGREMVATKNSGAVDGSQPSPVFRTFSLVMLELIVVMAAILFVTRRRGAKYEEHEFYYMRCPNCRQKIRYRERQVGQPALCPRCRKPFVFPAVDPYAVMDE